MERWLPVVGLEGLYEVSDHGRVRNIERISMRRRGYGPTPDKLYPSKTTEKIRALYTNEAGYTQVKLTDRGCIYVHILVLESFKGPCPDGMIGCHNNGNPGDNRLENLRWGTPKSNSEDMVAHGKSCRGERQGRSKLKAHQVIEIRSRSAETQLALAAEFNVTPQNIARIHKRETWVHI